MVITNELCNLLILVYWLCVHPLLILLFSCLASTTDFGDKICSPGALNERAARLIMGAHMGLDGFDQGSDTVEHPSDVPMHHAEEEMLNAV
jgi:hypothetical protein